MDQQSKEDIRDERHEQYGDFRDNLRSIGHIWGGILQTYLEDPNIGVLPEHIVSLMLTTFKCHRAAFRTYDEDSYLDASNYLDEANGAHLDRDSSDDFGTSVDIPVSMEETLSSPPPPDNSLHSLEKILPSSIPFKDWNDQCKGGGPITTCFFARRVGEFLTCNNDDCSIKRVWLSKISGEECIIPRGVSNFDDPNEEVQV